MKLSTVPQEPTLFKGSIRTNLDQLELHSDDEIWKVRETILKNGGKWVGRIWLGQWIFPANRGE
ncbi:putative ABC-type xenobiotic transporter [Helianthus anomalus]